MIQYIINALAPVIFLVVLGWIAGIKGIIDKSNRHGFSSYVINFSFPCLLFVVITNTNPTHFDNPHLILLFLLALMGMYLLTILLYKILYKETISELGQSAFLGSFPDMAFMGVPIFISLFGEKSLILIAIGNIISSLFMIPLTSILLGLKPAKANNFTLYLKNLTLAFKKPLVIAPLLGVLSAYFHIHYPKIIISSLTLIGDTTSGISLFTLGLIISSYKIIYKKRIFLTVAFKNLVHPALMLVLVVLFHFSGLTAQESILLCAMPTATMCTMFALKYNVLVEESVAVTITSTLFAVITLPVWMEIAHHF